MRSLTSADIHSAFDPIDRPAVVAPKLLWVPWDDLDYFAWSHPSEPRAFLVAALPERNVGLVLNTSRRVRGGMCDLCCGVNRLQGTMLVTAESWAQPRTKHGIHLCAALDCSDTVRGDALVYRMGETIAVGRRVERFQERLEGFVRQVTGVVRAERSA